MTDDPDTPSTEMEDEIAAEKGDGNISKPGDVQVDSENAFEAVVEDETKAHFGVT